MDIYNKIIFSEKELFLQCEEAKKTCFRKSLFYGMVWIFAEKSVRFFAFWRVICFSDTSIWYLIILSYILCLVYYLNAFTSNIKFDSSDKFGKEFVQGYGFESDRCTVLEYDERAFAFGFGMCLTSILGYNIGGSGRGHLIGWSAGGSWGGGPTGNIVGDPTWLADALGDPTRSSCLFRPKQGNNSGRQGGILCFVSDFDSWPSIFATKNWKIPKKSMSWIRKNCTDNFCF